MIPPGYRIGPNGQLIQLNLEPIVEETVTETPQLDEGQLVYTRGSDKSGLQTIDPGLGPGFGGRISDFTGNTNYFSAAEKTSWKIGLFIATLVVYLVHEV